MSLPRLVALQSKYNNQYLRCVNEDVQIHGFLQYSGEALVTPYTKYEIEVAQIGKGLVHIRCVYNNKYWVRWNDTSNYIIAGANEAEEDQSKWSCTLFEPVNDASRSAYRFRHVQLNTYVRLWRTSAPFSNCLFANDSTSMSDSSYYSTVVDWQSLCILPKYVAFKGNNGAYLKCYNYKNMKYLQFGSNNITDQLAGHQVFIMNDGSVRIKSTHWDYWRRDPDWIKADSTDANANSPNDLFWPVSLGDNVVALRSLGNNAYCKRLTQDGKTSFLNAGVYSITDEARMEVEELVVSREIYNVNFRLADARIYGQRVLTMATGEAVNDTNEVTTAEIKLTYEKTESSSWSSTVGLKVGVKVTVKSGVPIIAEGEIEVSTEVYGEYTWGEATTSTKKVEATYSVDVPPMSKVKVTLLGTEGYCDIPFAYTVRDTLADGKVVYYDTDDGMYTGISNYSFRYEAKPASLEIE